MAKQLISDELWQKIQPLLPAEPPKPKGGRPRISDRAALTGILFTFRTGIAWEMLPKEMGCGSGMTCWRRLSHWQKLGVWPRVEDILKSTLEAPESYDWSRSAVNSSSKPDNKTKKRAKTNGNSPAEPEMISLNRAINKINQHVTARQT